MAERKTELLTQLRILEGNIARKVREAASDVYNVKTGLECGDLPAAKAVELLQRAITTLAEIST
jgi:hypothetical protein